MNGSPYGLMYPVAAYWLSVIGGALILIYGLYWVVAAVIYSSVLESIVPGSTRLVIAFGVAAALIGLAIVFLGLRLKAAPGTARTSGLLIIVLSVISFVGGGGFFLGLILAFIGGGIAIVWRPPTFHPTMYGEPGYNSPIRQPPGPPPWQSASLPASGPASRRACPGCGAENPVDARYCASCGGALG